MISTVLIAILAVFAVNWTLLLLVKGDSKRLRIAVLTGLVTGGLSLFAFMEFMYSTQRSILLPLLLVFDVSIIAFLIAWNIIKTKNVYLTLSVPVFCVLTAITVISYDSYVKNTRVVYEPGLALYEYNPVYEKNKLAKLDENPDITLTGNLPVLDGATALYPVYASFVQAVYPENEYKGSKDPVKCSKTAGAYDNLLHGKADLIFCFAPSDAETRQFKDNGINIKLVPIGREAFVFFVNENNIVDNVTVENIRGIYSGKINNWKKLNGAGQRIRAFQRPENSGSQTILKRVMGNVPVMKPRRENISAEMRAIINQVAEYRNFPNAIGYSFLFYATKMVQNNQIKLLSVEGVYPSKETIRDGTYPFSDSFYAIYIDTAGKNENIEAFIEWILSDQGQELVSKTGYVPVN